jgi:hypothetical protein
MEKRSLLMKKEKARNKEKYEYVICNHDLFHSNRVFSQ